MLKQLELIEELLSNSNRLCCRATDIAKHVYAHTQITSFRLARLADS